VSWSSDRTGERRLHAALPLAAAGVAVVAMPASRGHLIATVALFAVAAAGVKAYLPAFWALPTQFLAGTAAAGSIGLVNSVGNLGGFVGPYVIGEVEAATGSFAAGLLFVGASSLVAAGLLSRARAAPCCSRSSSPARRGHRG
jgi:ACS family tartrate transporter-like MFS transporter